MSTIGIELLAQRLENADDNDHGLEYDLLKTICECDTWPTHSTLVELLNDVDALQKKLLPDYTMHSMRNSDKRLPAFIVSVWTPFPTRKVYEAASRVETWAKLAAILRAYASITKQESKR
ncbi:hypothetical protein ACETRX_36870 [Labrys portucalensis]|uniref:Uncharacterized protein n=1 Tax=Labrys neptuniae TaxID=376174 RepID=A0ABV6ZSH5_9HYPH